MTKNDFNQNNKYEEELINTFEDNFIFSNKPIDRFYISKNDVSEKITDKAKQLSELKKKISSIQDCNLNIDTSDPILGSGNLDSSIMIIGEAPGLEESKADLPFQGESGALLKKMFHAINVDLKRVYLSYSINFRTPEDRKPTSQEIKRYSVFMKEHISIINPKLLILMGSTAMESVTGTKKKISNERGKWKEIILKNITYPIMVTFSPSYLIRFPENKKYSWVDLKNIKKKIQDLNIKTS